MKHDSAPLSAEDAAGLYKLITGQEADTAHYAPLAERTDLEPRFSTDLRRRIDAALLGTPAATARCALPIGAQIALYALTICSIPALVIGAAQLRTPAAPAADAPATDAPAAVQPEVQEAEEEDEEEVESDGLLPEPPEEITPAPQPRPRAQRLTQRIQKKVLKPKAKGKAKKAAAAQKKKATATKKKGAAQKNAGKQKKVSANTKKKGAATEDKKKAKSRKARKAGSSKRSQEAPLLSPEEEMQREMQLPAGAAYRIRPRRIRRVRLVPAYYRYY